MIIQFNELELGVLTFHMSAIRNSVKQGFKRTYGKKEGKELLELYDIVKNRVGTAFERIESNEIAHLGFSSRELNLTKYFIDWYVPEIEKTFKNLTDNDQVQIDTLLSINEKVGKGLMEYAAV